MITRVHRTIPDPTLLGSFLDNHDEPRLASTVHDHVLVKNAAVFTLVNDGFPIVYQGTEHGLNGGADPMNREAIWLHGYAPTRMYTAFARLNYARRLARRISTFNALLQHHKLDAHTAALVKPPMVSLLTNVGSTSPPRVYYLPQAMTSYAPRIPVVDALTGQMYATDPSGGLAVTIVAGEPRVFLPLLIWEGKQGPWQAVPQKVPQQAAIQSPGGKGKSNGSGTHSRSSSMGKKMSWFSRSK